MVTCFRSPLPRRQLGNAPGREYMISYAQGHCRLRVYSLANRIHSALVVGNAQQDVSDNYNSNWVGSMRGIEDETIGGQGVLVVGVAGHIDSNRRRAGSPASLGLLVVTSKQ